MECSESERTSQRDWHGQSSQYPEFQRLVLPSFGPIYLIVPHRPPQGAMASGQPVWELSVNVPAVVCVVALAGAAVQGADVSWAQDS